MTSHPKSSRSRTPKRPAPQPHAIASVDGKKTSELLTVQRAVPIVMYQDRVAFSRTKVIQPEGAGSACLQDTHAGTILVTRSLQLSRHIPLKDLHALLYVAYVTGG